MKQTAARRQDLARKARADRRRAPPNPRALQARYAKQAFVGSGGPAGADVALAGRGRSARGPGVRRRKITEYAAPQHDGGCTTLEY